MLVIKYFTINLLKWLKFACSRVLGSCKDTNVLLIWYLIWLIFYSFEEKKLISFSVKINFFELSDIAVYWHQCSFYIFPIHTRKSYLQSYIAIQLLKFRNIEIIELVGVTSVAIYNPLPNHFFISKEIEKFLKIIEVNSRKTNREECQQVRRRWKFISFTEFVIQGFFFLQLCLNKLFCFT